MAHWLELHALWQAKFSLEEIKISSFNTPNNFYVNFICITVLKTVWDYTTLGSDPEGQKICLY